MKIKHRSGKVLVLAIACFLICSCGGGGGGNNDPGGGDPPAPDTTEYSTGNQDFDVAKAMEMDPLGDFRTEAGAGASPSRMDLSTRMPRVQRILHQILPGSPGGGLGCGCKCLQSRISLCHAMPHL